MPDDIPIASSTSPSQADASRPPTAQRVLTPEAQRALAEAEQRRAALDAAGRPRELHGRGGAEPVRYGDWEVKGLAVDF